MKIRLAVIVACLLAGAQTAVSQTALNMTELGHLTYSTNLSEVRGAAHNGREYALVGVRDGLSIVDVTDPSSPTEVFFELGPNSTWRDPFYHDGYAYCVTEGGGGLLIVDMSPLPSVGPLSTTLYTGSTFPFESAHNMFIDGENNKAYIFGTDNFDGAIILDISDPMNPQELGVWNDFYIHDGFVRGDTLWAACLEDGVFVVDVSIPSTPSILANWGTPSEFAHNVWPSDNNLECFTTDEVTSGFVTAYNMSNLQNVAETDKARHPLSEGTIPHITHFINDYLVTSYYRDGVTVHDVSDPSNMVLTGYFDSSPLNGNGSDGAWGAWPFLPSGNVLVSDIDEGLFILGVDYVQAARLEGTVTEFGSGSLLNDVQIEIVSTSISETTDLFGDYATGTATAGTYNVTFQKGGYLPQTVTNIVLTNGQTLILDVELIPDVPYTLAGLVVESGTGTPIEGATVVLENEFFSKELTTDQNGNYSDNNFFAGEYDVTVGAWGYVGQCFTATLASGSIPPNIELQVGYQDDFSLDLGWTVSGDATAGIWERGVPVGTTFNGINSNPDSDAGSTCGTQAFITGNGGGSAGTDDVDDGQTILTSPSMDLASYSLPILQFDYWFFNASGNSSPNDFFEVKIEDGSSSTTIASLPTSNNQWTAFSIPLSELVAVNSSMKLVLEVADVNPGHLVEGGLDNFQIVESTGIADETNRLAVSIFPNPAKGFVNFNSPYQEGFVQFTDLSGRTVGETHQITQGINQILAPTVAGVYLCEVLVNGHRQIERLLIHD